MAELQKSCFKASSLLSASVVVLVLWLSIPARTSMADTRTVRVGVILDPNSTLGCMLSSSLNLSAKHYYAKTKIKIDLVVRNVSLNDVVAGADAEVKVMDLLETTFDVQAASDLMNKQNVTAILGPQNSEQARHIVRLGEKFKVPVIWFPITGPSLQLPPSPSSLYSEQGLNCFQFHAIADVIDALGWQSVVPIYEETEYGSHLIPCLANVLKDKGIRMVNVTAIDSGTNFCSILRELKNMRTHVFIVHMSIDLGKRFIKDAKDSEMMDEGYAWILTQELSTLTDPQVEPGSPLRGYMQGALGVRPMDSKKKENFRKETERTFKSSCNSSLTIYGWWAYHTLEALAKAVNETGTDNNGKKLVKVIQANSFTGKSGINFNLSSGQLNQSVLEVYNVIGPRERIIGSWSPNKGLVQDYSNPVTPGEYPLKDPLWPGDTLDKPPKLRIGVPRTNSSPEFVNVDIYNSSDKPHVYGFAITVFLKAVDVLPFPLKNYDFVPLPNESRSHPGPYEYDDDLLCRQMKDQDLDAIIGDITIVGSRTNCVDFTLPYLDSGVAMLVGVKNTSTSKRILFKPFKWSLWLILGGIFVAATVIAIILETYEPRKITEEIDITKKIRRNPFLVYKIDVLDKFQSRAAGWMVILTSFMFILVLQVYTANLTSMLTQGKSKVPLFENENDTKSGNHSVGYRAGSWVKSLLIDQLRFHSSQLKPLGSREEYNSALSNGSVVAIFDETPYLTLFLSKYKSNFTMTGPIYKTGGFGFAFPKKSGLTSDFSTAILKVSQDPEAYHMLMAKSSLPTSVADLNFEDQSDIGSSSIKIESIGDLYPVLLYVAALFIVLSIPTVIKWFPIVTKWLSKKLPFKFVKVC